MSVAPPPGNYAGPPRRWPFPAMGRHGFLLSALVLLLLCLLPFWGSIAVAGVFAFGMHRPLEKLSAKLGGRRRLVSAGFVVAVTLLISFPMAYLGVRTAQVVAKQQKSEDGFFSGETMERAQQAYATAEKFALQYGVSSRIFESTADARESLRNVGTQAAGQGAKLLSGALAATPELFLTFFTFCLFLYTFLANAGAVKRIFAGTKLWEPAALDRAVAILQASSYNSLVANFLVGILQASIITIGARAVGYQESVLIFSVVFALSYIPFIGSSPPGYLLALISLILGHTGDAIAMAIVATFAGVIDNVVRPYLVSSGETEVHPVLSFAAILGAIGVFGLKGLFLGPVIVTAAASFLGKTGAESSDAKEEKSS